MKIFEWILLGKTFWVLLRMMTRVMHVGYFYLMEWQFDLGEGGCVKWLRLFCVGKC